MHGKARRLFKNQCNTVCITTVKTITIITTSKSKNYRRRLKSEWEEDNFIKPGVVWSGIDWNALRKYI